MDASSMDALGRKTLDEYVRLIFHVPVLWIALVLGILFLSLVVFPESGSDGGLRLRVTTHTLILLGLLWLPPLLKMIAMLGGKVQTNAGGAHVAGLIPTLTQSAAALNRAQASATASSEDRDMFAASLKATEEFIASTASDAAAAREKIEQLRREYVEVRSTMKSGDVRTFKLEQILAEVRAYAGRASFTATELQDNYKHGGPGHRVAVYAILQREPNSALFDTVLDAIKDPDKPPFEQYHALLAVRSMLSDLNAEQKQLLHNLLANFLRDEGSRIAKSTDRRYVAEQILHSLEAGAQ